MSEGGSVCIYIRIPMDVFFLPSTDCGKPFEARQTSFTPKPVIITCNHFKCISLVRFTSRRERPPSLPHGAALASGRAVITLQSAPDRDDRLEPVSKHDVLRPPLSAAAQLELQFESIYCGGGAALCASSTQAAAGNHTVEALALHSMKMER